MIWIDENSRLRIWIDENSRLRIWMKIRGSTFHDVG
jgi:hypothetical protein